MQKIKQLFLSGIFVLMGSFLFAQETTSEIQGAITDENNNPLAGATITAIHIPTGTKYSTTTRKEGRYNLANLKVGGPYSLTASFVGYKSEKQENITLLLGQEFNADMKLQPETKELAQVVVTSNNLSRVFNSSRTGSQVLSAVLKLKGCLPSTEVYRILQSLPFVKLVYGSFGGRNDFK